jgi:hypothetical protein
MMEFHFDKEAGLHLALVNEVWVCPVCKMEAPVVSTVTDATGTRRTFRCPTHPDAVLTPAHHMIPDPVALMPGKNYGWEASRQPGDLKPEMWQKNWDANKPVITDRSVWDLPEADGGIVYLVGSGPSLAKQLPLFENIKRGTVITLNDAQRYVRGHYFFALDYVFDRLKPEHAAGTTAILAAVVTPMLARLPWKDIRWVRSAAKAPIATDISVAHPKLWAYWEGLNCTTAAIQTIAAIFKPQTLVLCGMDCGFPNGERHIGEPLKYEPGQVVECDFEGRPVITDPMMLSQRDYLATLCTFFAFAGVHVVNATEGGIAFHKLELEIAPRAPLKSVIEEHNAIPQRTPETVHVDASPENRPQVGAQVRQSSTQTQEVAHV